MDDKKIVENIFKMNGIKWEIKDFNSYIDPKCKTSASIYSKLIRLYSNINSKTEYTVLNSGIKDLLRMTVIIEYSEVIPTIQKLKQSFPDLSGYLKSKKSGYRGIHLNLKIDGLPCEIQLAPKMVVMAVDYLHTLHEKWRDFDSFNELELLTQREYEVDFELRRKTYGEIFNAANFSLYKEDIAKTINELNANKEESLPITNPTLIDIFNKNLLSEGKLDKDKVRQVAEQLSQNLGITQDKFINLVKGCLQL